MRDDGSRWDSSSLATAADDAIRARIMKQGVAPDFDAIAGWEFAGTNTAWIAFPFRKFKKGFFAGNPRHDGGPEPFIQGYNVNVKQDGVGNPHRAMPSEEAPKRHGFYRVHRVVSGAKDDKFPDALLLDYSLGGNFVLDPSRRLRDYLVQVYPDDPTLLLGDAYIALLGLRIHVSYFVLERMNEHDFTG